MKIRCDFVSNSSSSSYIVACKKQYLDIISKDLVNACINKKSTYHNKDLKDRNQRILDFCLNTYELLFLGELFLETKKVIYNLKIFEDMYTYPNSKENLALEEWNDYKKSVANAKKITDHSSWEWKNYGRDEYDPEKDEAIHYEDETVSRIVISHDKMDCDFGDWCCYASTPNEKINWRLDKLLKIAKSYHDNDCIAESIDIYQITKNTIQNTRDLINAGHKVDLDKWEDLDKLEKKIEQGDAIFYIRIAYEGDGYGNFYIYCEDGADGIDGISGIEYLNSECL